MCPITSEAIIPFDGIKDKDSDFSQSICTIGLNQKTGVKKILTMTMNLSDQINLSQNIDLTDKIDNSEGAVIECTILITINKTQLNTIIQDWTTHDWGTINF